MSVTSPAAGGRAAHRLKQATAHALSARLEIGVPALLRALDPPPFTGNVAARLSIARYATTRAYLRARIKHLLGRGSGTRTQPSVREMYNRRWAARSWSSPPAFEKLARTGRQWFVVNEREPFVNWFYVLALMEIVAEVRPARVLEIGSGNGFNSNTLAMFFPDCEFIGLELTLAGVRAAQELSGDPSFRTQAAAPFRKIGKSPSSIGRRASFTAGSATALPFADNSFDLVCSVAAVEQMNPVHEQVFREVARVTRGLSAHLEPFGDFNRSPFSRMHLTTKDYFRASARSLRACGLDPVYLWGGFPRKIHFTAGLVVAEKRQTAGAADRIW